MFRQFWSGLNSDGRRRRWAAAGCALIVLGAVAQALSQTGRNREREEAQPKSVELMKQAQAEVQSQFDLSIMVQPGTEREAKDYYARISVAGELNFPFEGSNLNDLLRYMGYAVDDPARNPPYGGLTAKDLETIASFDLMPQNQAEFDRLKGLVNDGAGFDALLDLADFQNDAVLVSRFFAPKISTYYDATDPANPIDPDAIVPGWRKLVRLTARRNSTAEAAGTRHMYLLFNVKQPDVDADPFVVESLNNQVILVPFDQSVKDSAYFAVYGKGTDGYKIGYFLGADFDLPGHVGAGGGGPPDGKYFVPKACAECHGHSSGIFDGGDFLRGRPVVPDPQTPGEFIPTDDYTVGVYKYAKPNYLDTDQWYDWLEFDYRGVATSLNDVVFDGGKAHGSAQYARAMNVIKALNTTIRDQTFAAEKKPGVATFSTQAADKWLNLHATDLQRIPYSQRSIGGQSWDASKPDEMRLLRLLDNHCFRCHSSLIYNVFDREAVKRRFSVMTTYMSSSVNDPNNNPLPGFMMPQGRVLPENDREEMIDLLNTVFVGP